MMKKIGVLLLGVFLSSLAVSAELIKPSKRAGKWEAGFLVNHVDSWDVSGDKGSSADVDSNTGWGFTVGYNINEHFNAAFEFTYNEQSYDATIVPTDPMGLSPQTLNHKLDMSSYTFNFNYNLLAKTFTPYIAAGAGWNYIDSNVSDGEGGVYCWYDPWWGYVCDDYYSTYSDTAFSYSIGAGLRWELTRNFLMKASVNERWIELDKAAGTPEMLFAKFEFVWAM